MILTEFVQSNNRDVSQNLEKVGSGELCKAKPKICESERLSRTELLIGGDGIDILKNSRVAVFGVGGVGGYVVEALARAGIGSIDIIDNDVISESNINRQIIADYNTIGRDKTEVMKERILSVNPNCKVKCHKTFYLPEGDFAKDFDFKSFDYVVDAIDTVAAKIDIICRCKEEDVRVISSMGTGNKLDNSKFEICPIEKTSVCPLAKVIRKSLRQRGIKGVKVLYSKEEPKKRGKDTFETARTPASISFVPPTAGLLIAGEVIRDLLKSGGII